MLLVYDVTDIKTFNNIEVSHVESEHLSVGLLTFLKKPVCFIIVIKEWMRCISENTHEFQIIQKVLLANKVDLPLETHHISSADGQKLASKHNMEFFEVSAKEGKCIDDVFMKLAQLVVNAQGSENQVYLHEF